MSGASVYPCEAAPQMTLVPRDHLKRAEACLFAVAGMAGYLARYEQQVRRGDYTPLPEDVIEFITREVQQALPDTFARARAAIAAEESLVEQATRAPGMVAPKEAA